MSSTPTPTPPPVSIPLWEKVFIGPRGLRAGWKFGLFVVILVAFVKLDADFLGYVVLPPNLPVMLRQIIGEVNAFAGVVLATLILAMIEGRPMRTFGLPFGPAMWRPLGRGLVWGVVALTSLLLVFRAVHVFHFGRVVIGRAQGVEWGLIWAAVFLLVGLTEEFAFRGYALTVLSEGMGFWPAAVVLSLLFGAVHLGNSGEAIVGAASAAAIGLVFCLTRRRTGTLWFAVGMHAAWDYCESFVYGTLDSGQPLPHHVLGSTLRGPTWLAGGTVGPEGSLLVFPLVLMIAFIFLLRTKPRSG